MIKSILALAITSLAIAPAMASDWWYVGYSGKKPQRMIELADLSSIQQGEKDTVQMWYETYYEKAEWHGIVSEKILAEFDCKSKRIRTISSAWYNAKGEVIGQHEASPYEYTMYSSVYPDSMGGLLLEFACGKQQDRSSMATEMAPNFIINNAAPAILRYLDSHDSAGSAPPPPPHPGTIGK